MPQHSGTLYEPHAQAIEDPVLVVSIDFHADQGSVGKTFSIVGPMSSRIQEKTTPARTVAAPEDVHGLRVLRDHGESHADQLVGQDEL